MSLYALRRSMAAFAVLALLSCGGDDGGSGPDPLDDIESVTVSPTTADVEVGATMQLDASAVDGRGDPVSTAFAWTSSDETRATVSGSGLVSGVSEGPVTIRATAGQRTGHSQVTVVDPNPPQGASGLQAVAVSDTEVQLTWEDDSSNEDEFRIEREAVTPPLDGPARVFAEVATVGPNVTTYLDEGLEPDASYRYRVSACNQNGCSAFTADAEGATYETLEILTTTLPDGVKDVAYEQTLQAGGGDGPPSWSVAEGTPPEGLALDAAGTIAGTPTVGGTSTFTVQAEGAGQTRTRELSITVSEVVVAPEVTTTALPDGGIGAAYEAQLHASKGDGSYAWALVGGALPDGLSLGAAGAITGTPTAEGTTSGTFEVTSAEMTGTAELSITVHPVLAVTTESLADGVEGQAYEAGLAAEGGDGATTWSLDSGELPEGLTLETDGTIAGTPAAEPAGGPARVGTSEFVVRAESGVGQVATKALSITIHGPLAITTTELPDGQVTVAYDETLAYEGGDGSNTWSITDGALPPGLALDPDAGAIAGTPTDAGSYAFTVQVESGDGQIAEAELAIDIATAPLTITTTSLPDGNVGVGYTATLQALGGPGGLKTWSLTDGAVPTGLNLTPSTGQISGTPSADGTFEFTVRVVSGEESDEKELSITISADPPVEIVTTSLPNGTQGVGYLQTVEATGGDGTYAWEVTSGTLPTGLSLNASNGQISGTPTELGTSNFNVQATSGGDADTQALSITIVSANPLVIETVFLPPSYAGAAYSGTVETSGGQGGNAFSVIAGSLPPGLTLGMSSGTITGTPGTAGTYHFTIAVTDGGAPVSHTYMISVSGAAAGAFNFHMHNIAGVLPSAAVQTALNQAVAKWEEVITGNITNIGPISGLPATFCDGFAGEFDGKIVDDIEVLLNITDIDGPGGTLASAGPCAITTRDGRTLPVLGVVNFDADDLDNLDATQLRGVIFHELGHVVGLGTLWSTNALVTDGGGVDPRYTGSGGVTQYQGLGGTDPDVAVENTGGGGTRDVHWREATFNAEVMTGFAEAPGVPQPISAITIGGTADLGYTVDLGAAESYAIPGPPAPGAPAADEGRPPFDDIRKGPVAFVMPDGTIRTIYLGGS